MIVFHGDQDPTVNHVNADRLVDQGLRAFSTGADRGEAPAMASRPGGARYPAAVPTPAPFTRTLTGTPSSSTGPSTAPAMLGRGRQGSYTDPQGPDASAELMRFFAEHARGPRIL